MMNMTKMLVGFSLLLAVAACGKKGDVKPPSQASLFSVVSVNF